MDLPSKESGTTAVWVAPDAARLKEIEMCEQQFRRLIKDLIEAGVGICRASHLPEVYRHPDAANAVPVIVEWFERELDSRVRLALIRAMRYKSAAPTYVPLLLAEWHRHVSPSASNVNSELWAVGDTLESLVQDWWADELIEIATDRAKGRAREMPVMGLGKLKDPRAFQVLVDSLEDPDVCGHAIVGLARLKEKRARPYLEAALHHEKTWIRQEARAGLRKLDRALEKRRQKELVTASTKSS